MTSDDSTTAVGGYDDLPPMGLSRGAWRTLLVIAGNLAVLLGVLFLGWSLRSVLLLYWAETVLLGVLCMLRWVLVHGIVAIPLVMFFTVHFGMFSFVHLVFLLVLTSGIFFGTSPGSVFENAVQISPWVLIGLIFLALPHVFAMARQVRAEWHDPPPLIKFGKVQSKGVKADITNANATGGMPYGRVVVMHVAILGGAFLTIALGSPVWLLVILVLLKTAIDLAMERAAQKKAHADGRGLSLNRLDTRH